MQLRLSFLPDPEDEDLHEIGGSTGSSRDKRRPSAVIKKPDQRPLDGSCLLPGCTRSTSLHVACVLTL